MTPRLEKIQPPTAAPLKILNDGNSARLAGAGKAPFCQRDQALGEEAIRQNGNQPPAAQRAASRREALRFRKRRKKKTVQPSTADVWRLHHAIQRLLRPPEDEDGKRARGPSVCGCGYASLENDSVALHVRRVGSRAKAFVTGTFRCNSPWLCVVCAGRAAAKRQARVQKVAEATMARGGLFAHVVLTVRHTRDQTLADLKGAVAESSRAARAGRAWKELQKQMQAVGVLSAPEVTYSPRHGWHFHTHLGLSLLTDSEDRARAGCEALVNRYLAALRERGYDATWAGQEVVIAQNAAEAAAYIAKGLAWEISGGAATKTTARKVGSLTPFQIAERASQGDRRMRGLWLEYAAAMPGTRSCVVTASIAKTLNIQTDDQTHEEGDEVADACDPDKIGELETITWNRLLRYGYAPALLGRIETEPKSNWPIIKCWAESASREVSPALRPDDIPTAEDTAPPTHAVVRHDDDPPQLSQYDRAADVASRAASAVPARTFIEREMQTMKRDWTRFGGFEPPTPADVIAAISRIANERASITINFAGP